MKAKILKIGHKNVELLLENHRSKIVPKEKLRFDYDVGDTIILRKNGNDYIYSSFGWKEEKRWNVKKMFSCILLLCFVGAGAYFTISLVVKANQQEPAQEEKEEASTTNTSSRTLYELPAQKTVDISCLNNASQYLLTDEEIEAAYGDTEKLKAGYQKILSFHYTTLACYEATENDSYASTIAEIKQKISEVNSVLASLGSTYQPQTTYETPSVTYTPSYQTTKSCDDYHSEYYSTYKQGVASANREYNNAVYEASLQCAANGTGFGGCNNIAERKARQTLNQQIATYKSNYRSSMNSVGCNPATYVDF